MRTVGANPRMAFASGVPVPWVIAGAVLLSGALAGAAGAVLAAGQQFRLTPGIGSGLGFSGIVITFLARNHPLGIVVAAVLIAGLYVAGDTLQVFYNLPAAMIGLLQAIILLTVVGGEFFSRYRLQRTV
jgi:simple sugar transport system permease protein